MGKVKNLVGHRYGKLTVIKHVGKNKHGNSLWSCRCDCGETKVIQSNSLRTGNTRSCGCLINQYSPLRGANFKTHGHSNTRLYKVWWDMKSRCFNKNTPAYIDYGGRGITICDEWLSNFLNFYNWAINNGYRDGLTIDRIDNDGNYEPSNCRWITMKEQTRNRRSNIILDYLGEKHIVIEWAKKLNMSPSLIYQRLDRGWSVTKTLSQPSQRKKIT